MNKKIDKILTSLNFNLLTTCRIVLFCFVLYKIVSGIYYYLMVLGDLGRKITSALQKFSRSTVIDENTIKECLGEISNALLASDVSVKYVLKMR